MRYGRLNAGVGPAGGPAEVSLSIGLGDGADMLGEGEGALVGGGSMEECDVGGLDPIMGSGREGISSSVDDVSIVICFVGSAF